MRTWAIGDIHGCLTALQNLEDEIRFGPEDTIITLGDYVDRGPDSRGVLDHLIALGQRSDLVPLRGNHEVMMLAARFHPATLEAWLDCGGFETLESYGPGAFHDVPEAHWRFLEGTRRYHETDTHIFVHASVNPRSEMARQPDTTLFWERITPQTQAHLSGRRVICGHTPQPDGVPLNLGHSICIDTHAYGSGWLTCLHLETGAYWQGNQTGQIRQGQL
jgi:serine/threonine protein phosphatase 1